MDSDTACSGHIMATIMMFKNNSNAKNICGCLKCLEDNRTFYRHYNKDDQESCFIENRHEKCP